MLSGITHRSQKKVLAPQRQWKKCNMKLSMKSTAKSNEPLGKPQNA